jgi:hypothetical protein
MMQILKSEEKARNEGQSYLERTLDSVSKVTHETYETKERKAGQE